MPINTLEKKTYNTDHLPGLQGLTESEVRELRASGQGNVAPLRTSRSSFQIVRENVFTSVNMILFVLGIGLIWLGQTSDAIVSVSVVFFNVLVGVVQEIRAKRTLDRIALLNRPAKQTLSPSARAICCIPAASV